MWGTTLLKGQGPLRQLASLIHDNQECQEDSTVYGVKRERQPFGRRELSFVNLNQDSDDESMMPEAYNNDSFVTLGAT